MQVFLPFPDFRQSVACLDKSRLGNQIWRECKTLLNGGWANHPAAKMWQNYKPALALYGYRGLCELLERGHINTDAFLSNQEYFWNLMPKSSICTIAESQIILPPFIGNEEFHRSHRLNLLFKNPSHYSKFFKEPVPLTKPEYVWPIPC